MRYTSAHASPDPARLFPLFCTIPWSARAGPPGATYDFARILIALLTASAFLALRSQAARVKENYCHRKFNQSGRIYPPGDPVALIFHRVGRGFPSNLAFSPSPAPSVALPPLAPVRDICVKTTYIVPAYNALRALCVPNTRNYARKLIRSDPSLSSRSPFDLPCRIDSSEEALRRSRREGWGGGERLPRDDHSTGVRICSVKGLTGSLARDALCDMEFWRTEVIDNRHLRSRSKREAKGVSGGNSGDLKPNCEY